MSDRTVEERARDVDLVEQMISRIAVDDAEAAAARRLLGVDDEAARLSSAYAPEPPPPPPVGVDIDHAAHTRATVSRYQAWVEAHPDDDPTPLRERKRILQLAQLDLARLERREPTP